MAAEAPGMKGQIKSLLSTKTSRDNPSSRIVCREVESEEFAAQRALIVGGSRGLGEVTAKLLAAGGAEVVITYYHGEQDARRIVAEIVSHGANAEYLPLNVLEPLQKLLVLVTNRSKPLIFILFRHTI